MNQIDDLAELSFPCYVANSRSEVLRAESADELSEDVTWFRVKRYQMPANVFCTDALTAVRQALEDHIKPDGQEFTDWYIGVDMCEKAMRDPRFFPHALAIAMNIKLDEADRICKQYHDFSKLSDLAFRASALGNLLPPKPKGAKESESVTQS